MSTTPQLHFGGLWAQQEIFREKTEASGQPPDPWALAHFLHWGSLQHIGWEVLKCSVFLPVCIVGLSVLQY